MCERGTGCNSAAASPDRPVMAIIHAVEATVVQHSTVMLRALEVWVVPWMGISCPV